MYSEKEWIHFNIDYDDEKVMYDTEQRRCSKRVILNVMKEKERKRRTQTEKTSERTGFVGWMWCYRYMCAWQIIWLLLALVNVIAASRMCMKSVHFLLLLLQFLLLS